MKSVGLNIRKYRKQKNLRQEQLAEMTGLSTNYIGMVERGEKTPALETFIRIVNALGVTSDMILCDVLSQGYIIKNSMLTENLEQLSPDDRKKIFDVIETMIKHSNNK